VRFVRFLVRFVRFVRFAPTPTRIIVETASSKLPADLKDLEPLRQRGTELTTSLVSEILRVSAGTARSRIKSLVALGLLIEEGKGRSARYRWVRGAGN